MLGRTRGRAPGGSPGDAPSQLPSSVSKRRTRQRSGRPVSAARRDYCPAVSPATRINRRQAVRHGRQRSRCCLRANAPSFRLAEPRATCKCARAELPRGRAQGHVLKARQPRAAAAGRTARQTCQAGGTSALPLVTSARHVDSAARNPVDLNPSTARYAPGVREKGQSARYPYLKRSHGGRASRGSAALANGGNVCGTLSLSLGLFLFLQMLSRVKHAANSDSGGRNRPRGAGRRPP